MPQQAPSASVDVVGVGINATDTIIRLPHFPAPDSKIELLSADIRLGGQVASATVACARWGLRARYVGKIGEDQAGQLQREDMEREGVDCHWITSPAGKSQTSFILVDGQSGDRTVLWKRDAKIALRPEDLKREWISGARALLIDGHDTEAAAQAARWARAEKIPVVGDLDNLYPGVEELLRYVDFPVTSSEFPQRLTGEKDLLKSLPSIMQNFKCRLIAATLGYLGVILWDGSRFMLCPGFRVAAIDTTGAGDIFHGAFLYGLLRGWPHEVILEFSCSAAALNCEAPGARGGIKKLEAIDSLRRCGERSELAYTQEALRDALPNSCGRTRGQ
jgi:sulfofructose kinase